MRPQSTTARYAFVSNGGGGLTTGDTTYSPNPMPAGGTSQTTVSGPGDSGFVEVGFHIVEIDDSDTVILVLEGDCVAEPTTTTSSEPAASSTAAARASRRAPLHWLMLGFRDQVSL